MSKNLRRIAYYRMKNVLIGDDDEEPSKNLYYKNKEGYYVETKYSKKDLPNYYFEIKSTTLDIYIKAIDIVDMKFSSNKKFSNITIHYNDHSCLFVPSINIEKFLKFVEEMKK